VNKDQTETLSREDGIACHCDSDTGSGSRLAEDRLRWRRRGFPVSGFLRLGLVWSWFVIFLVVGGYPPPALLDSYQNKGLANWAVRKCMKRKEGQTALAARKREVLRLAALAQDDYPRRIVSLARRFAQGRLGQLESRVHDP